MRSLTLFLICGAVLSGCATSEKATEYICANGPNLVAVYSGDSVRLEFNNGATETMTRPDPSRENFYGNGAVYWSVGMRDARLDMDGRSLLCDQL